MSWQQWVLLAWFLLVPTYGATLVGKERPPFTGSAIAWNIVISCALGALVVSL
jgi:hypothetical protein